MMEGMMEMTRGRAGAYGGVLPLCLGWQIEWQNKEERRNNELALDGCCFIFRHNIQSIVGVSNGRDDGGDVRLRRNVWGGVVEAIVK